MKPERSGRAAHAEQVGGESRMGRLRDSALSGERADPLERHTVKEEPAGTGLHMV